MDKVFNSAKKVYADNYLEYKLTNDPKYKLASDSALASMRNVLDSLGKQTQGTKNIAEKIVQEKDLMRDLPEQITIAGPDLTWKYIILGGLAIVAFGLMVV